MALSLCFVGVGCGGVDAPPVDAGTQPPPNNNNNNNNQDAGTKTDGGMETDGGMTTRECSTEVEYAGTLSNQTIDLYEGEGMVYEGQLNALGDTLFMEMYDNYGLFEGGPVRAGIYQLAGEDLNYKTCSLCVGITTESDEFYMATGGTVTITEVGVGFEASLSDVTFQQVNVADDYTSTPHESGCTTSVPSGTLNVEPPVVTCEAEAAYNGTLTNEAADEDGAGNYMLTADLNGDPDGLQVVLMKGRGAFMNGAVAEGIYPLLGDELDPTKCGVCVRVRAEDSEGNLQWYLPTGGEVTITSVTPNIKGALKDVTLRHMSIASDNTASPHYSGCTSGVAAASFDAALPPVICSAETAYAGTLANQEAEDTGGGDVWFSADLNGEPDALRIELYAGSGVFSGGIITGTHQLTAAELNYKTCGLCVRIRSDKGHWFMATGGEVSLTSVAGNLTGSLSNVTFEQVTIASDYTSSPHTWACTSGIASASFDSAITPAP